jgi:hypothetical protein
MVNKYIVMEPREVRFVNEEGEPISDERQGLMTWKKFLHAVEDHPKWATTYRLGKCMDATWIAFEEALERGDWVMVLDEKVWKELEEVCQTPKFVRVDPIHGPREMAGWGIHARLNRQMICFPSAVINATDKDPRKKEEKIDIEKERALLDEESSKKEKVA